MNTQTPLRNVDAPRVKEKFKGTLFKNVQNGCSTLAIMMLISQGGLAYH